jgi:hypothetical protein
MAAACEVDVLVQKKPGRAAMAGSCSEEEDDGGRMGKKALSFSLLS